MFWASTTSVLYFYQQGEYIAAWGVIAISLIATFVCFGVVYLFSNTRDPIDEKDHEESFEE